ncbi:hypothetical protein DFH08DRAFT_799615 [Mycena albidolilacea]|uniref:NB-ARC domain-containing protein n=1 Tax=Mycena albidolilacea TaxID=1033008 RepID=A0AAD7F0J3_9AGAR|nr:hypothetical protein DFH08DRAFT_799615 [Mycena albidolilacea]
MPRQSTLTESRVTSIVQCLTPALTLLKELNDAFGPPFILPITNTIESLISMTQLMEKIHPVLYAMIGLYMKSETVNSLPPIMLENIGKFMETLRKIYAFLEAQQDGNKLKHLFCYNEMQNLLQGCHARLDQAAEVFKITARPAMISEIDAIKKTTQLTYEELLELIQTQSEASTISDRLLPGHLQLRPKIFHGRELEVDNIMKMLGQDSPRIAILGGGGMGKTILARAVLHHPDTSAKFEERLFVSAESATTSIELAALIGLHVGLNQELISHNLLFLWELIQSRGGIEEVLALLTALKHLALIPLSAEPAHQTFMEITDNVYKNEEIEQILQFTDNMPLAMDLIAHLSDYEGLTNVLAQWDTEKTALLSVGPRITSNSKELLRLLSILPDGLSDAELVQSTLPIPNILSCKTVLLATSLAFRTAIGDFEHVRQFLPPSMALVQCLRKLFYALLELYKKYDGEQLGQDHWTWCFATDRVDSTHCIWTQDDNYLMIQFMTQVLLLHYCFPPFDGEQIITQGIIILELVNNPPLESKFYDAVGSYILNHKYDLPQASQFFQRALKLAKMCSDSSLIWNVLINIASLQWMTGEYYAAQAHASEVQRLSQFSANLYHEARALQIEAQCLTSLGNFKESRDLLHRSRVMLGICGLADGNHDHSILLLQGEVHLKKSEYAEARNIYNQIIETHSPEQEPFSYALSLVNLAHIDTLCGDTVDAYCKLNKGIDIFRHQIDQTGNFSLTMFEADIELTEEKLEPAKVKFEESLTFLWGKDNEVELFCLGRLADIRAWPARERHSRWPVMYCGYAYKYKHKLELHKPNVFLGDVFLATKDDETATNLSILWPWRDSPTWMYITVGHNA